MNSSLSQDFSFDAVVTSAGISSSGQRHPPTAAYGSSGETPSSGLQPPNLLQVEARIWER